MSRLALLCVALAACFDQPRLSTDTSAIELPRGAGTDVEVRLEDELLSLDQLVWLIDDPTIVSIGRTADGTHLRVQSLLEGTTAIHLGSHGEVIDLPTHVAPPAFVQLWIEPANVETMIGEAVGVRATAIDTTNTIRDVTDLTVWQVMDPGVATFEDHIVSGTSAGTTMLDAALPALHTTAPVTVH
jgi:hypothetical protein